MKLAGILFLIATIVYFLIKWKKAGNKSGKSEINKTSAEKGDEKKKTDDNASSAGYWKKNRRSLIVWIIILQFIVLNLIYPGEWFEVKKIFWFFAPRISGKYLALKEYKDIVETDKKKKLSDIQEKIRKFEKVKELSTADIKKLNELTKQAEKINDVYSETAKPASAKPKEEVWDWTFEWEATAKQMASGRQKIPGIINDTCLISCNDNVLKFRYKRPSGKLVDLTLDRSSQDEYYFGRVAQSDLYLRVWLLPNPKEPGNFKGTADNGPNTISMEIFLKKKL